MKVLIAEDEPVCRRVLEATLKRLGHECLSATTGDEAWELFVRGGGADVVLSDWLMPGINGPELCRRVREMGATRRTDPGHGTSAAPGAGSYTYFVFLTSLEDQAHFLEGVRAGADDYLLKPLDPVMLEVRLVVAERVTRLHQNLQNLNRKLWDLARHDALTELFNRLQLTDDLDLLRAHVDRQQQPWTVALCDVDNFKRFNDLYGHLEGDDALRKVAGVLRGTGDTHGAESMAYRYGGEEFCLLLEASPEDALAALEAVRARVQALAVEHGGNPPSKMLTVSIGAASLQPGDGKSVDAVLREADTALYAAKQRGRNAIVACPPSVSLPAWPAASGADSGGHAHVTVTDTLGVPLRRAGLASAAAAVVGRAEG